MRALFLSGMTAYEGSARIFETVARALGVRGYETWFAVPAESEAARCAAARGARVVLIPERRNARADARALREQLPRDFVDVVFTDDERVQLAATFAVRGAKRGGIVRRVPAGGALVQGWRGRRAERLVPARHLYTSESPPTGYAAPSGTLSPMRAELGAEVAPLADAASESATDGSGDSNSGVRDMAERDAPAAQAPPVTLACVATRASLRRATNVVRAAALLAQRHTALRLRVFGSVAHDEEMKLLAAALGIARRVEWVGYPLDWRAAMRDVAAGWVVADGDDAAMGALDLMAHGVAVLAERTSVAARYVSHGIQGTLMATPDPPLMAAETAILLSDRARRMAMGAAGRSRVEREFPLRDMLSAFEHAARSARERGSERLSERPGDRGSERRGARGGKEGWLRGGERDGGRP
ncbi:MAG: glycosyltransferase [Gemmatimonadaceae bacterium]|nr:glycosyltransferase [Gemmatimonadaceae bacterium]